ncbi:MAG: hypothetical protein AVDCRST_MAG69-2067, partial [uncultured Solirubrobacteraceae bacterium]
GVLRVRTRTRRQRSPRRRF